MKLTCSGPMTQRLTLAGVCAYMLAATTVFFVHRAYYTPPPSVHVASHVPKHAECSYQTTAFATQYEAVFARSTSPPMSLQALQRHSDPRATRSWADCLPMRTVVCGVAAGAQDSLFTQSPLCRSAAVHHLVVAASAAIEERGHIALPIGSGLQHMWEHGALAPEAPSIDMLTDASMDLTAWFWARGFAHFQDVTDGRDVTCMAPHHTLASLLYADNATDATPPHLRWSKMRSVDDQLHIGTHNEHAYRLAQLTPPSCLPLYDASIMAPAHPATFFTAAHGMRDHDDLDVWYPNTDLVEVSTYDHGTPYLDLYSWNKEVGRKIKVETAQEKLDVAYMFPLTCHETIFGNHVPSIQFPEAMFRSEYGITYASDPDLHLASCESYCDYQLLDTNE
ncbi:hypothetical protein SDRG_12024 [Saprolegnia diclina VS20]|uniref:Uncharacterized protein n=1 Tax=Saprolegnia diclina (strain VS20) TaxID=1156394 RepID=T0Q6D7_SAPDV|nr:hypothetical protein SDRG_12024 [Saprolegnia diclina VS20]EQC30171.1 hypothetical protein SDRG_12024 [Saprolegnia diclina VS20]|eukprot:XP_008616303.1 hypothetical protein SDRG_12024 [Saprolegnia diclina VS20]